MHTWWYYVLPMYLVQGSKRFEICLVVFLLFRCMNIIYSSNTELDTELLYTTSRSKKKNIFTLLPYTRTCRCVAILKYLVQGYKATILCCWLNRNTCVWYVQVWELKRYFYPSAGGLLRTRYILCSWYNSPLLIVTVGTKYLNNVSIQCRKVKIASTNM